MNITCNGRKMTIGEHVALVELIRELHLDPETVVAECDGRVVPRDEYATLKLNEGAVVELIRFVGGG